MGRISSNLESCERYLRPKIESLSNLEGDALSKAMEEIQDIFSQNGLDWGDIACVLFECPRAYEDLVNNKKPTPQKAHAHKSPLKDGSWIRSRTGSLRGMVNGSVCTIFPSKRNDGTFCTVINVAGGDTEWKYDFGSEDEAQDYLERTYGQ